MDKDKLKRILEKHRKWVYGEGGQRADLRGANLREADLWMADLRGANLREADLWRADLREADLREADLWMADLRGANLREADLWRADLWEADLWMADLRGADLWRADLWRADLREAYLWRANLREANLREANLQKTIYSVVNILRSFWLLPPDAKHLTLELMAHDAESCGIGAMDKWAEGKGNCPFEHSERDYYFKEDKQLWLSAKKEDKVPKLRGRKLLEALAEATGVKL